MEDNTNQFTLQSGEMVRYRAFYDHYARVKEAYKNDKTNSELRSQYKTMRNAQRVDMSKFFLFIVDHMQQEHTNN